MAKKREQSQNHEPDGPAQQRYAAIVAALGGEPGVSQSTKKGFAFAGLMAHGKLFAMPRGEELLLKLPAEKVAELIGSGDGVPFDANRGRPMKEWVTVKPSAAKHWLPLAREAMGFVAGESAAVRPTKKAARSG